MRRLALALIISLLPVASAWSQEDIAEEAGGACTEIPATPDRLPKPEQPNPDRAYELSEFGYAAAENTDWRCAAYYNVQAFTAQPDPILLFNVAKALEKAGFHDASLRYAQAFISRAPTPEEKAAGRELIGRVEPALSGPDHAILDLERLGGGVLVDWVRYEPGDRPLLPRGVREMTVSRPGQPPVVEAVEVPQPLPEVVVPPSTSTWDGVMIAGVSLGGVGLALIIATIAIDLGLEDEIARYDDIRDCIDGTGDSVLCVDRFGEPDTYPEQYDELGAEIEDDATLGIAFAVVGSVSLAAGIGLVIYHFVADDEEAPTEMDTEGDVSWSLDASPRLDGGGELRFKLRF